MAYICLLWIRLNVLRYGVNKFVPHSNAIKRYPTEKKIIWQEVKNIFQANLRVISLIQLSMLSRRGK